MVKFIHVRNKSSKVKSIKVILGNSFLGQSAIKSYKRVKALNCKLGMNKAIVEIKLRTTQMIKKTN